MEVKPFKAFRFNRKVVGKLGNCIAPPYDVISIDQQKQLYQKSKYNIVRIIKGKTNPSDNETKNQYTRAADYLKTWIAEGAVKQDSAETIYAYVQDFELAGNTLQRFSFVALAKLEQFGDIVRPHEQILTGPLIDRLKLKRATAARFGLVFMLYTDPAKIADKIIAESMKQEPLIDFVDEQQVRHRLFAIATAEDINTVCKMMSDKRCIIADGHHRYTTGLEYLKENPSPSAKYQMMAFVNTCHEGLVVLATHRLVANVSDFDSKKLVEGLAKNFEVVEYKFDSPQDKPKMREKMLAQMHDEHKNGTNAFGIYTGDGVFYLAVLKNHEPMELAAAKMSKPWRQLDVAVLHKLILEEIVGIDEQGFTRGANVEYVKDAPSAIDEMIDKVDNRQKQAAFFMNPPKIEQIEQVADCGERMPQKSTYFYPKIFTGLTINKL